MKKIIYVLLALSMACQPANAQFFKKIFKKKAKTEKKAPEKTDSIDDNAQMAMQDIATLADNTNNRNAFMGIPLGIKAARFEKLLLEKGFTERKLEGNHTAKSYIYDGEVFGTPSTVTLAVSDLSDRVYAVDATDNTIYNSEKEVKTRFLMVKSELQKVYGNGYVDNQGEAYTIQTRLGTVNLHYERGSLTSDYTLSFALDDAKAYKMAYSEMDDKEYETTPRKIDSGLAAACNHTDLVGLGVRLWQNRTVKGAQSVLGSYDYTIGKMTAKAVPASVYALPPTSVPCSPLHRPVRALPLFCFVRSCVRCLLNGFCISCFSIIYNGNKRLLLQRHATKSAFCDGCK